MSVYQTRSRTGLLRSCQSCLPECQHQDYAKTYRTNVAARRGITLPLTTAPSSTVTTAGQPRFVSQFHAPRFGEENYQLSSFAMSSDSDPAQASSQQQQPPQQHQQDHMYSQLAHHPPMGSMALGPPMGMGVASCSGGMMPGVPTAPQDSLVPKFPPQNFDVPDITLSNSLTATSESEGFQESVEGVMSQPGSLFENILSSSSSSMETSSLQMPPPQTVPMQPQQSGGRQGALSTINQSQVAGQLGFQSMRTTVSPAGSGSSPAQESSEDSDDSLPLAQLVNLKRAAAGVNVTPVSISSESSAPKEAAAPVKAAPSPVKRQRGGKKKKKKDPNEPQKPVSAYSLFFRDTQSSIKLENPSASFGEVSRIVASMWDSLDPNLKEVYKKRTEVAKKEYLKQLAAYRASQVSQSAAEEASAPAMVEKSPSPPSVQNVTISPPPAQPPTTVASVQQMQQQQLQHMQQHLQQQQMQMQQQTASQPMLHHSPPPHYSNTGVSHGEMSRPSYQLQLSPPQQPQMDPVLSAAHDSGLFPPNSIHQSPSGLNMLCVRDGCQNMAVENPGWDAEYCSNECVVTHCRDIFTAWVAARGGGSTFPVK